MAETRYELASLWSRLFAIWIDGFLLGLVGGTMWSRVGWGGLGVGLIIGALYCWFFWTRYDGQTPGKMLLGIRVIKADGTAMTDADALIRFLGYSLNSVVFSIGWLWVFFDDKKRGWHDLIAQTYVVVVPRDEGKKKVDIE